MKRVFSFLFFLGSYGVFAQHKIYLEAADGMSAILYSYIDPGYSNGLPVHRYKSYNENSFYASLGYKYLINNIIGIGLSPSVSTIKGKMIYEFTSTTPPVYSNDLQHMTEIIKPGFVYLGLPFFINLGYKRFSIDLGLQLLYAKSRMIHYWDEFTYANGNSFAMDYTGYDKDSGLGKWDHGIFAAINYNVWKRFDVFIRYYKSNTNVFNDNPTMSFTNIQLVSGIRFSFFVSKPKETKSNQAVN